MAILWLWGLGPLLPRLIPGVVWPLGHWGLPIWLPPVGVRLPGWGSLGGAHGAWLAFRPLLGGPGGIGLVSAPLVILAITIIGLPIPGTASPVVEAPTGVGYWGACGGYPGGAGPNRGAPAVGFLGAGGIFPGCVILGKLLL